ncbi:MAG: protein translocase subunit SecF [Bacilli bacterium]|nr:protein translocase subunit SecF [Bacilli bacterium]
MKGKNKKKKVILTTCLLLLITAVICYLFVPLFSSLKFGLDLQGGFEILYKAESIDGSKMTQEKLTATYKTLSKRIDSLGVSEPEIVLEGNNRIRVKLAGVTDPETARSQLSTVATLTFRDTDDNLLMTSDVLSSGVAARVGQDQSGNPAVALSVKDKDTFYDATSTVSQYESGKNLIVIWLDYNEMTDSYANEGSRCGSSGSNCLSAATVSQGFASDVIIQGNFTQEEVQNLVDLINSGSLPSKLTEISSNTVGASFGDQTLQTTLVAGIIGVVAISLILMCVYHFAGLISSIGMIIYAFLVFLVFWVVGGVLTLPGIAALVLGIGMAVDSNVITFSRIRDELYMGKGLTLAYKEGIKSSFSAIIDSNITTFIVAIIMFMLGESSIKGFATVLIITVLVTMFTMVFLTRWLLNMFIKTGYFEDKPGLFINVKKTDIPDVSKNEKVKKVPFKGVNFFKHKKLCYALSILIILSGVITFCVQGFNLGIDYKAGTNITIVSDQKITKKAIKEDLANYNLEAAKIEKNSNETSIRIDESLSGDDVKSLNKYLEDKYDAKVNIGVVSNLVAKELVKNAIISILFALVGIILYISLRFKFSYAFGGVVALVHDVLIIASIFAFARLEVASMFIAAILAIVGYSINDTIVLFDRIRENLGDISDKKMTKERLEEVVNESIAATFTRTIYTSLTTLLPIIALMVLGSSEILNFNIAMLIGVLSGTYSSIFIASTIFIRLESKNIGKPKKVKKVYTDEYEEKKIKGVNC